MLARLESVETKLPTEFHKWASPADMRARSHSAALRATDIEIETLGDRVKRLEGPLKRLAACEDAATEALPSFASCPVQPANSLQ